MPIDDDITKKILYSLKELSPDESLKKLSDEQWYNLLVKKNLETEAKEAAQAPIRQAIQQSQIGSAKSGFKEWASGAPTTQEKISSYYKRLAQEAAKDDIVKDINIGKLSSELGGAASTEQKLAQMGALRSLLGKTGSIAGKVVGKVAGPLGFLSGLYGDDIASEEQENKELEKFKKLRSFQNDFKQDFENSYNISKDDKKINVIPFSPEFTGRNLKEEPYSQDYPHLSWLKSPEEVGKSLLQTGMKGLETVDKYTGRPTRAALLAALEEKNPLTAAKESITEDKNVEGKEVAKALLSRIEQGGMPLRALGQKDYPLGPLLGAGVDVLADPTNLIGASMVKTGTKFKKIIPLLEAAEKIKAEDKAITSLPPHFLFSAENPLFPEKIKINKTNEDVAKELIEKGMDVVPIKGKYGSPEQSLMVKNVSPEQAEELHKLASDLGQESSIYSTGNQQEMRYHHGENAGKSAYGEGTTWHESEPKDLYSTLPSGEHFTHKFNFDELLDPGKIQK